MLGAVGGRMVLQALQRVRQEEIASPISGSFAALIAVAIDTSMDAMAVGVSLAFLEVDIVVIAAAIGLATFLMSAGGTMAGRLIGARLGVWAEILAGVGLVGLGVSILVEHLSA